MLTYATLSPVLQWIPIKLRHHLVVRGAPSLKVLDERTPNYYKNIDCQYVANQLLFRIEDVAIRVIHDDAQFVVRIDAVRETPEERLLLKRTHIEPGSLRVSWCFIKLLRRYLGKRSIIGHLFVGSPVWNMQRTITESAVSLEARTILTAIQNDWFSMKIRSNNHIHSTHKMILQFTRLPSMFAEQKKVGDCLVLVVIDSPYLLSELLHAFEAHGPKRGVTPVYTFRCQLYARFTRRYTEKATHLQCVVLELEHADVRIVSHVMSVDGHEKEAYLLHFELVPKHSIPIVEPQDWLTTFECDGSFSYVDMS